MCCGSVLVRLIIPLASDTLFSCYKNEVAVVFLCVFLCVMGCSTN